MADTYTPPGFADDNATFGAAPANVPKEKSAFRGCLMGCLIVGVLMLLATGFGAWYVSTHWQQMIGSIVSSAINEVLEQSELPEAEKAEIRTQVSRVTDAMSEGQLTGAQLEMLMNRLTQSPLFATMLTASVEAKYFDVSGLSDEEKEEGSLSMKRCIRGMTDGNIDESGFDEAMVHIGNRNRNEGWQLRDEVSDEELRAFLAKVKELADEAEVPMDVEEIDPSDELKKIIDGVLDPETAEQTEDEPAMEDASEMETAEEPAGA